MRPTPRKLALLMSFAGLGLSLGEAAHARSDLTTSAGLVTALGLSGVAGPGEGQAPVFPDAEAFAVPSGVLDTKLAAREVVATTPSEEDRAAIALAMVLMAEPFLPEPAMSLPVAPASSAWEYSDAFTRDLQDAPVVDAPSVEPAVQPTATATAMPTATAVTYHDRDSARGPGDADDDVFALFAERHVEPAPVLAVDLDLSASGDVDVPLEIARVAPVDLPLDLAPASVDLDLDLASNLDLKLILRPGLDLNLDLGADLDLRLDRPPLFPISILRPASKAESVVAAATEAPQPGQRSEQASVQPSAAAAEPEPTVTPLPTIVVASHAERVMHSLEALLSSDPTSGRFGAQTAELFVTSHAERTRLMLAATCKGGAEHADIEIDIDAAPVAPEPQAAAIAKSSNAAAASARDCTPDAAATKTARPARRSALGDKLVAMSEGGLDRVRGGFQTAGGLQISFGIERAVYVNGALVATTSLNLSDAGKLSTGQSQGAATPAAASPGTLTLIQNGAGNTFVSGPVSATSLGTVVQNTLNDQKIQSVTSINAMVNSLQIVKAQNFQSSLRGAIIDSLRR